MKTGKIEFGLAREFLLELRKEFRGEDEESVKVAKIRRIEQERKTREKFVFKE